MATSVCVCVLLVKCFGRMTTTGQQRPWLEKVLIKKKCGSNVLGSSFNLPRNQTPSRPFPRLDHAAVLLANGKDWRAAWDDWGEFSPKGLVILDPKNMVSTVDSHHPKSLGVIAGKDNIFHIFNEFNVLGEQVTSNINQQL